MLSLPCFLLYAGYVSAHVLFSCHAAALLIYKRCQCFQALLLKPHSFFFHEKSLIPVKFTVQIYMHFYWKLLHFSFPWKEVGFCFLFLLAVLGIELLVSNIVHNFSTSESHSQTNLGYFVLYLDPKYLAQAHAWNISGGVWLAVVGDWGSLQGYTCLWF